MKKVHVVVRRQSAAGPADGRGNNLLELREIVRSIRGILANKPVPVRVTYTKPRPYPVPVRIA